MSWQERGRLPIQNTGTVSWKAAERAYENYARRHGRSQSMERMAERGGFGLQEFAYLYYDGRACGPNPGQYDGDEREWSHVCRDVVRVVQELGTDFEVTP